MSNFTGGWGADLVFEASGSAKAFEGLFDLVRPGGGGVLVGMPVEPVPFDVVGAQVKEARIETIFRYANVHARAIELIASGKVDLKPLISGAPVGRVRTAVAQRTVCDQGVKKSARLEEMDAEPQLPMDAAAAVKLEPLGVTIHEIGLAKPRLLETVALLGAGPIGLLVLQVLKVAGAGEVHVVEPLDHRRAAALELGADRVAPTVGDLVRGDGAGGYPLVIEATNNPLGFQDAVLAARIGGRVVLAGIPDGDTYTLPAAAPRRRGLNLKFVRRMGEDYREPSVSHSLDA